MVDTYLVSSDEAALKTFCAQFLDVLGPKKGSAAIEESFDETTNERTQAEAAKGDPERFYACVRDGDLSLPDGIEECDAETASVVGVWA